VLRATLELISRATVDPSREEASSKPWVLFMISCFTNLCRIGSLLRKTPKLFLGVTKTLSWTNKAISKSIHSSLLARSNTSAFSVDSISPIKVKAGGPQLSMSLEILPLHIIPPLLKLFSLRLT
jgi:hypothetical protein